MFYLERFILQRPEKSSTRKYRKHETFLKNGCRELRGLFAKCPYMSLFDASHGGTYISSLDEDMYACLSAARATSI